MFSKNLRYLPQKIKDIIHIYYIFNFEKNDNKKFSVDMFVSVTLNKISNSLKVSFFSFCKTCSNLYLKHSYKSQY